MGTRACQPHAEYISCAKYLQSCTVFKASVIGSRPAPTVVATSPLQHCVPTRWRKVCLRSWVIWKYTATGLVGVPDCRSPTEFCVHEQVATSRRLIFQTAHVSMPTFPIKKTRHDFFRLREKIVAGFSNLQRAPDHTRLQKTAHDTPRACQNYI